MIGPMARGEYPVASLGHVAEITLGKMIESTPKPDAELVPYIKAKNVRPGRVEVDGLGRMYATLSERSRLAVQTEDIFVIEGGATAGRAAVVADEPPPECVFQNAVHRVRAGDRVDQRFLYYVLAAYPETGWYDAICSAATFKHLTGEKMAQLAIPLPSLDVQRRVADMLDAETARIDTLIVKNQRAAELAHLHERVAVSNELEGGGLSQEGRWPAGALRWFDVDIQTGPFGSQLHADEYVVGGWPVCNPSNLVGGRLVADPDVTVSDEAQQRLSRHQLLPGDLVFGRRGELGRAALVTKSEAGWICGTGSLRVRFLGKQRLLSEYLLEVLSSWGVRAWFGKVAHGSTMQNLNEDVLASLPVPNVPLSEQERALEAIGEIRGRHAAMRSRMERLTDLLRLRRQALITEAVTGQIDV